MNGDQLMIVINNHITSIAIIIPITIGFFTDYAKPYSLNFSRVKIFAVEPGFLIPGQNFCGLKAFLKLNACLDKYFKVKIFTAWDKTSKSGKFFTLKNFRLYGNCSYVLYMYIHM